MVQLAAEVLTERTLPDPPPTPRPADERPHTSARARMHPLTLRFEPGLEAEFEAEYYERTLSQVRLALVLAFILYALFGILDVWIAPNQRRELWTIRFAVVAPMLLA